MNNTELRYAHLGNRDTPARAEQRAETTRHIAEIQAEQAAIPVPATSGPRLQVADRYRKN